MQPDRHAARDGDRAARRRQLRALPHRPGDRAGRGDAADRRRAEHDVRHAEPICASCSPARADGSSSPGAILAEIERQGGDLNFVAAAVLPLPHHPADQGGAAPAAARIRLHGRPARLGAGPRRRLQPGQGARCSKRPYDGTLDTVDFPPLWAMRERHGGGYHWDGLQDLAARGVPELGHRQRRERRRSINVPSLDRMERWTDGLAPARYPFAIDRPLAGARPAGVRARLRRMPRGRRRQDRPGDPDRLGAAPTATGSIAGRPSALAAFEALDHYAWRYTGFRKTNGYLATPLDGHLGARALSPQRLGADAGGAASPPAARPVVFGRGSAAYDTRAVGFCQRSRQALRHAAAGQRQWRPPLRHRPAARRKRRRCSNI